MKFTRKLFATCMQITNHKSSILKSIRRSLWLWSLHWPSPVDPVVVAIYTDGLSLNFWLENYGDCVVFIGVTTCSLSDYSYWSIATIGFP